MQSEPGKGDASPGRVEWRFGASLERKLGTPAECIVPNGLAHHLRVVYFLSGLDGSTWTGSTEYFGRTYGKHGSY